MNNHDFAKLNLLDSKSIEDIRFYSMHDVVSHAPGMHDYFGTADLMNAHLWPHEHFSYTINDYGFRDINFPSQTDIAAFGCSFTFGSGMPKEKLWHNVLANMKNSSVYNFGLPGRSIATIIDIFLIASKHIDMKSAVFLFPSFTRTQLAVINPILHDTINFIDTDVNFQSKINEQFGIDCDIVYRALTDVELFKIARNKIYLLNHIAKIRNIKVFISSWEEKTYNFFNQLDLDHITILPRWQSPSLEYAESDLARDRLHPGINHHELWARAISDHINI